jgi:UDP-N-acetylglucosamine 4-epimerase
MKILVTGGAGFIGSNLVEKLLSMEEIELVRVLDNLATGSMKNIQPFLNNPRFEFVKGDIRDWDTCVSASHGMDVISHQAALGSVPRSIQDPVTTNNVNITGTTNIFFAAKHNGISRVVYAASSSTYGDSESLPKVEHIIGKPLSPYAVTKYVNELYADVFGKLYGIGFIGLRYFNVFGPRQNPKGAYAAVIPLFAEAVMNNTSPFINGDGEQSRDFTYVANAVEANIRAIFTTNPESINQVYNIAFGEQHTVNRLFEIMRELGNRPDLKSMHREGREGDIRHSLADITKARTLLKYDPQFSVREGLGKTLDWYKANVGYFES